MVAAPKTLRLILAHRLPELKDKLHAIIEDTKQVGLRVNFKKSKLMRVEIPNQNALSKICNNSEEIIEDVEQLCYLESVNAKHGGAEANVN